MARNGKIGDWNRLDKVLSGIGRRFRLQVGRATNKNGRLLARTIVGRIEKQQLSPPLKAKYRRWKIRKGFSEQILIMHSDLIDNIKYRRTSWMGGFVGILANVMRKDTGQPLVNIAAVHENGTKKPHVPARPYVRPGAEECKDQMVRNWEEAVERVFKP